MRIETRTTFIFGVCCCFLVGIMTSILIVNASFDALWLKIGIFGIIIVFCFSLVSRTPTLTLALNPGLTFQLSLYLESAVLP